MNLKEIYSSEKISEMAQILFNEERQINRLDGWFLAKEIIMNSEIKEENLEIESVKGLLEILKRIPLSISDNAIFAGTQRDAFARSYALINPTFKVESFSGYCDPTAVFSDIEPNEEFTCERINKVREYNKKSKYVNELSEVYKKIENDTCEVIYFAEQVTGHLIPSFKPILKDGIDATISEIENRIKSIDDEDKICNYKAMKLALSGVTLLSERYAALARELLEKASSDREKELILLENTLKKVSKKGADNLYEAIQLFILLWQVMCLEQVPNPFAFSVGNADRIFEPYRAKEELSREMSAALFKHFLVFFNVGDRSWAISQNVMVGGKDINGEDLTSVTSYAILDAYFEMNLPQPILSVKLHKNTPIDLYKSLGRFFFTPGCLTPSVFNDDSLFTVLSRAGVEKCDLENYSIAGCQEPLIMGEDNANTTNSWLNLAKILELCLNNGVSAISGKMLGNSKNLSNFDILKNIREIFYKNVDLYLNNMVNAANGASKALSNLRVPFLSVLMGGIKTGYDLRDTDNQGTKYNGSGCLIHGLSVIADSFIAIEAFLEKMPDKADELIAALSCNFAGYSEIHEFLKKQPKFGNNIKIVDDEAVSVCAKISKLVASKKNYLGNPFRPDFSSPSTHLLYGYYVAATPDGRNAREMLGYGIDPLYGEAQNGLGFRTLSTLKLPFLYMNGGYASHFGVDPNYFKGETNEDKGIEFKKKIIEPLFFNADNQNLPPFYLYVNITTPEILRKVLGNPKKYAPNGVYIMRIHGTFVNFLDLSPAIQEDIIKRLDLKSTEME